MHFTKDLFALFHKTKFPLREKNVSIFSMLKQVKYTNHSLRINPIVSKILELFSYKKYFIEHRQGHDFKNLFLSRDVAWRNLIKHFKLI